MYKNLLCLIISSLLLLGCNKNSTHDYLLAHPDILEAELEHCQENNDKNDYCAKIKQIAEEYITISNEQHNDPQAFGKKIMQKEADLVTAELVLKEAKNGNDPEKITKASDEYYYKLQEVNTLLAVVAGSTTPGL